MCVVAMGYKGKERKKMNNKKNDYDEKNKLAESRKIKYK